MKPNQAHRHNDAGIMSIKPWLTQLPNVHGQPPLINLDRVSLHPILPNPNPNLTQKQTLQHVPRARPTMRGANCTLGQNVSQPT